MPLVAAALPVRYLMVSFSGSVLKSPARMVTSAFRSLTKRSMLRASSSRVCSWSPPHVRCVQARCQVLSAWVISAESSAPVPLADSAWDLVHVGACLARIAKPDRPLVVCL